MAFTSGLDIKRGDGAGPEVFTQIPEVFNLSGLGQSNPTIDVTHWQSTSKQYIAGLADGEEVTLEINRLLGNATQDALIADVNAKLNRNFEFTMNDGAQTETFTFTLAMASWNVTPSNDDKHTLTITGKLSGSIGRVVA